MKYRLRRRRWQVFDEESQCAGNLKKQDALEYARGRASIKGQAVLVCRVDKNGVLRTAGGYYSLARGVPSKPL